MNARNPIGGYVFVACFAFIAGMVPLVGWILARSQGDILTVRGIHEKGVVQYGEASNESFQGDRQKLMMYSIHVAYPVGRTTQTEEFPVSKQDYDDHPYGTQVEVVYDPQHPDHARLGGAMDQRSSIAPLLIGVGIIGAGLAYLSWGMYSLGAAKNAAPDIDQAIREAHLHENLPN